MSDDDPQFGYGEGQRLGGALGIAALGTVGAAVYRSEITAALPGLPQAARETLAGAAAVAGQASGSLRGPLMEAASAAFVSGLRATVTRRPSARCCARRAVASSANDMANSSSRAGKWPALRHRLLRRQGLGARTGAV